MTHTGWMQNLLSDKSISFDAAEPDDAAVGMLIDGSNVLVANTPGKSNTTIATSYNSCCCNTPADKPNDDSDEDKKDPKKPGMMMAAFMINDVRTQQLWPQRLTK